MGNINPSVLATTAGWSRIRLLILILICSAAALPAQSGSDELSDRERRRFNELYFEAVKQKNLDNPEEALDIFRKLYKITENNPAVCYEIAGLLAEAGEGQEALYYAERATRLDSTNKWYWQRLADIYGGFGNFDDQIEVLQHLLALDSTHLDYHYELAMAYRQNNQSRNAIAQLDRLEQLIGINEVLADQKKKIYLELGELENAALELERLIEQHPRKIEYLGNLAQLYLANDLEEEAYTIYQKMLDIDPGDPRIHLDLARYHQKRKEVSKSIHHLKQALASPDMELDQKVPVLLSLFEMAGRDSLLQYESYQMLESLTEQHPDEAKAFALYGDFLSRDGRDEEALKAYKTAVSLEGGNRFQIWEQILLLEVQNEAYDSLQRDASRAAELFPNQPLPYFMAGIGYAMNGNHRDAVIYLEDGLNYVLGNPRLKEQFYAQLGSSYHELDDNRSSDKYFDKALELNPRNETVLNNYAYYLSLRGEKLDKALEMTEMSNRLSPDNPTFLDTWAWVLYKMEDYEKALKKIEKALELGGGDSGEVLEHYGDILIKNGQPQKAREAWEKAKQASGASSEIELKINAP